LPLTLLCTSPLLEYLELPMDFSIDISTQSVSIKLVDVIINRNNLSKKLSSMIFGMLMGPSVIILQMDLLTNKTCQKKLYLLHFVGASIVEYNISPIKKLYVISSMIFLHLLVNFICNRQINHWWVNSSSGIYSN